MVSFTIYVYSTCSNDLQIQTRLSLDLAQDDIRSLLSNHVCGNSSERSGDVGEDRGIHDTQTSHAANPEARVKNSHWVVIGTNGAGRRSVVTPSSVLGILRNISLGCDVLARKDFLNGDSLTLESIAGKSNGLGQGSEIGIVVTLASVEVVVRDFRHVKRIGRSKLNGAGGVARVRLQDGPCEKVVINGGVVGVTGEVATEIDGTTENEEIILVTLSNRTLEEHSGTETGRGIDATVSSDIRVPAVEASIGTLTESASLEGCEVGGCCALYVDLVVILEIGADTGEVLDDRDIELPELGCRTYTTELKELRRVLQWSLVNEIRKLYALMVHT